MLSSSWDSLSYGDRLRLIHRLTAPALASAAAALAPPPGGRALDAGCGIGTHARVLAQAGGPGTAVAALDLSLPNLLELVTGSLEAAKGGRVAPVSGSLLALPFADACFDLVWCADVLWPGVVGDDPVGAVRELARVLRPGGRLAVLFWSGQSLLPGHPALEARLDLAFAEHAPYLAGVAPDRHHLRALGWLTAAGLEHAGARTFVAETSAPLAHPLREALAACFAMLWGDLVPHLQPSDRRQLARLCRTDSPECILDQPGYHAFVTYTMFTAQKPR